MHCGDSVTRIFDTRMGAPVAEGIRHKQAIIDLKFSPDGRWLATAERDRSLRQWNAQTGEPRGEPIVHRDTIVFFGFSPDGNLLLSSDYKHDRAQIHDAASGRLLAQTPERPGRIYHVDFSSDGERVITASEDGIARIWHVRTGHPHSEPLRHKGRVLMARFSSDARRVVTASEDGTARVWDVQTSQPVGEPMTHRVAVRMADFSLDNLLVVAVSVDGTARLWDANTGRPVAEPFVHTGSVHLARFSPDGRRVFTVSESDGPRTWDVRPLPQSEIRLVRHSFSDGGNPQSQLRTSSPIWPKLSLASALPPRARWRTFRPPVSSKCANESRNYRPMPILLGGWNGSLLIGARGRFHRTRRSTCRTISRLVWSRRMRLPGARR